MNILMPQLGETVTEGTIITWCKREGEGIKADDVLLEIETDKASVEVPSPVAGMLSKILLTAGQTVTAAGDAIAMRLRCDCDSPDRDSGAIVRSSGRRWRLFGRLFTRTEAID